MGQTTQKVCVQCGGAFDATHQRKIYCGKQCKVKANHAKAKANYVPKSTPEEKRRKLSEAAKRQWEVMTPAERESLSERLSEAHKARWANVGPEERKAHGAKSKGRPSYERSEAHKELLRTNLHLYWRKIKAGHPATKDRDCRCCGTTFSPSHGRQYYCSKECKDLSRGLSRYGISYTTYTSMLTAQTGVCAICGTPPIPSSQNLRGLVVDHCHDTGKVRGLLCSDCNTSLGRFHDSEYELERAIAYLRRFPIVDTSA